MRSKPVNIDNVATRHIQNGTNDACTLKNDLVVSSQGRNRGGGTALG